MKKYIVCAWNSLKEVKGPGGTKGMLCWQSDPMAEAIIAYIESLGKWQNLLETVESEPVSPHAKRVAQKGAAADLIVLVLRDRDKPLSMEELTVFHAAIGARKKSKPKKVLYVHVAGHTPMMKGRISDWLYRISRSDSFGDDLNKWLEKDCDWPETSSFSEFRNAIFKKTIEASPSSEKMENMFSLKPLKRRVRSFKGEGDNWASRTSEYLMASPSILQLFFGLCRIRMRYDRLEHDVNATGGDPSRRENMAKKNYLDRCFDLHAAMCAYGVVTIFNRVKISSEYHEYQQIDRNVILFIDDNPDRLYCAMHFHKVINAFLPGYKLWVWDTESVPGKSESLDTKGQNSEPQKNPFIQKAEIENYSSWSGLPGKVFVKKSWDWPPGSCDLLDLLARTCVVLVDVLFKDAGGADAESGYGIIRGLHRLCRDRHADVENFIRKAVEENHPKLSEEDLDKASSWNAPEIIAVSRASDLAKVQATWRFGAGGYILKERWHGLPGVIAAGLHQVYDHVTASHRNFRLLYDLPHNTISMLHSTVVPPLELHRSPDHSGQSGDAQASCSSAAKLIAPLLAALPKADIHVHPGSCMSPEFLVIASLVMLLRHDPQAVDPEKKRGFDRVKKSLCLVSNLIENKQSLQFPDIPVIVDGASPLRIKVDSFPMCISMLAQDILKFLKAQIDAGGCNRKALAQDRCNNDLINKEKEYSKLRSILHKALGIPDHQGAFKVLNDLDRIPDSKLFFFALLHGKIGGEKIEVKPDDLLRCVILAMAKQGYEMPPLKLGKEEVSFSKLFTDDFFENKWVALRKQFYLPEPANEYTPPNYSVQGLRKRNWRLPEKQEAAPFEVKINLKRSSMDYLAEPLKIPNGDPIAWLLASGTRSTNLREYLDGCEYSGAEHLRHPFLMHLFAQQVVYEFVRHGVLYAELRVALSGYENAELELSFSDACACFGTAMGQAEKMARERYRHRQDTNCWLWEKPFDISKIFNPLEDALAAYRFPCKTSVILTGKRDKMSRVLVREAGAGAVLHARPSKPATTARKFVDEVIGECRVVGFDLAGQEDEHPPHIFRTEYEQIARMHIPVTIHAGENAPAGFVESAILDLRARRLGHGLALADDSLLMDRARDDGVCVELCPVSNFQTNALYPHGKTGLGREYPLRTFLEKGINVCINTDNPIISFTNMVKECFQASYAYGGSGLTLWDLLRVLRTGFTQSFLTLPERRVLLELADQIVFDLFSRTDVQRLLRILSFE